MKTLFDELQCEVKNWWLSLLLGILYVVVAVSLMFAPLSGYAVLSILFSISMLFSGLLEISFAVSNRKNVSSWGWYIAFGILAVICSLIILWQPAIGALYAVYMISFAFLIIGFFRIMLSFELKSLHKRGKSMKEENEDKEIPVG